MIDLSKETLVSIGQAARKLSTDDHIVNPSTVWRWMTSGCQSRAGGVVKLDAAKVGGRWYTSDRALQEFAEALTGSGPDGEDAPAEARSPKPRPASARRRAAEKASRELERAGA